MRNIDDTVASIAIIAAYDPRSGKYRTQAAHDPKLREKIYAEVHGLLVDQMMTVANAISPENDEETRLANWLQSKLIGIAKQYKEPGL
jgi:hypothetical protein